MMNFSFLTDAGPIGGLLTLSILAIISLYKRSTQIDDNYHQVEEQRIQENGKITFTLQSLENDMKSILIAVEKNKPS